VEQSKRKCCCDWLGQFRAPKINTKLKIDKIVHVLNGPYTPTYKLNEDTIGKELDRSWKFISIFDKEGKCIDLIVN
jgi:hypothetical protein